MSLNFYQPHQQNASETDDPVTEQDVTPTPKPPLLAHHRSIALTQSVVSTASMLGDDMEMQWDMDMMDAGRVPSPKIEFEPVSLCVISVQPLFNILKVIKQ